MDPVYKIYCHRNKINNKIYIGQTCQELKYRWHPSAYKTCIHFYRAIQKYGWENFEHIIVKDNLTQQQANYWEEYYIQLYKTTNEQYGYNILPGGSNRTLSNETKQKIGNSHKGQKHSEETKQKISKATTGKNNPRAKKVLCVETNQVFDTAKEAGAWVNKDFSAICKVCNGKGKTCGGYHWKYVA